MNHFKSFFIFTALFIFFIGMLIAHYEESNGQSPPVEGTPSIQLTDEQLEYYKQKLHQRVMSATEGSLHYPEPMIEPQKVSRDFDIDDAPSDMKLVDPRYVGNKNADHFLLEHRPEPAETPAELPKTMAELIQSRDLWKDVKLPAYKEIGFPSSAYRGIQRYSEQRYQIDELQEVDVSDLIENQDLHESINVDDQKLSMTLLLSDLTSQVPYSSSRSLTQNGNKYHITIEVKSLTSAQ